MASNPALDCYISLRKVQLNQLINDNLLQQVSHNIPQIIFKGMIPIFEIVRTYFLCVTEGIELVGISVETLLIVQLVQILLPVLPCSMQVFTLMKQLIHLLLYLKPYHFFF